MRFWIGPLPQACPGPAASPSKPDLWLSSWRAELRQSSEVAMLTRPWDEAGEVEELSDENLPTRRTRILLNPSCANSPV